MPGAQPHPQSSWAEKEECPQVVRQGRNRTALPAQWLYGLLRALPGVPGFLATIAIDDLDQLNSSVGESGPHGLTVRDCAARLAAQRVHRNPRRASWRSRNAPPEGRGMTSLNHNFCVSETRIF